MVASMSSGSLFSIALDLEVSLDAGASSTTDSYNEIGSSPEDCARWKEEIVGVNCRNKGASLNSSN